MGTLPYIISSASTEYVRVPVSATVAGSPYNPTADTVKMAFMLGSAVPAGADLKAATWETDTSTSPATYRAMCLVGPAGTVSLVPGTYTVWVQVTDSPEVPLRPATRALKVV